MSRQFFGDGLRGEQSTVEIKGNQDLRHKCLSRTARCPPGLIWLSCGTYMCLMNVLAMKSFMRPTPVEKAGPFFLQMNSPPLITPDS